LKRGKKNGPTSKEKDKPIHNEWYHQLMGPNRYLWEENIKNHGFDDNRQKQLTPEEKRRVKRSWESFRNKSRVRRRGTKSKISIGTNMKGFNKSA
jgi:hypothetical protein